MRPTIKINIKKVLISLLISTFIVIVTHISFKKKLSEELKFDLYTFSIGTSFSTEGDIAYMTKIQTELKKNFKKKKIIPLKIKFIKDTNNFFSILLYIAPSDKNYLEILEKSVDEVLKSVLSFKINNTPEKEIIITKEGEINEILYQFNIKNNSSFLSLDKENPNLYKVMDFKNELINSSKDKIDRTKNFYFLFFLFNFFSITLIRNFLKF